MRGKTGNSGGLHPAGERANNRERNVSPDRLTDSAAQLGLNGVRELQKSEPIECIDVKRADKTLALSNYTHTNARE
jgi:hypothetical protein